MVPDRAWSEAFQYAQRWVEEAEKQSLIAHGARKDWERRIESERAAGCMGIARGTIAILEIFRPGDDQVAALRRRLNHCPVLQICGARKEAV